MNYSQIFNFSFYLFSRYSRCFSNLPHRTSKLFILSNKISSNDCNISKSTSLLQNYGFVELSSSGLFIILPFGYRVVKKISSIIDEEMELLGAQKVIMPSLVQSDLLKKSGRLAFTEKELFKIQDRNLIDFFLTPTHEEIITKFIHNHIQSHKKCPILFYQITSKFRDEKRPRGALLRAREFLMKDLYSFDVDLESAKNTYEKVVQAYHRIFDKIGIPIIKVSADPGDIGGILSHEFIAVSKFGEEYIYLCEKCNFAMISLNDTGKAELITCEHCGFSMSKTKGFELGHTFILSDKYSKPFDCKLFNKDGILRFAEMGCFGLGITRIMATAVEVYSKKNNIIWPYNIAPYSVAVIPPKAGSKEEKKGKELAENISRHLCKYKDVLIDDRIKLTIGARINNCTAWGIPHIITVGRMSVLDPPKFEIINTRTKHINTVNELELLQFFESYDPNQNNK